MANTRVIYWEKYADKNKRKKRFSDICFARVNEDETVSLIYAAKVKAGLKKPEIEFYISFLEKILDKSLFKHKMAKKNPKTITWELQIEDNQKFLLYLTAFRYVDEFSLIIKEFYKHKDETDINKLFEIFANIHVTFINDGKYYELGGHGLIYAQKMDKIVNFKEFQENLKDKKIFGVNYQFFKKYLTNANQSE